MNNKIVNENNWKHTFFFFGKWKHTLNYMMEAYCIKLNISSNIKIKKINN